MLNFLRRYQKVVFGVVTGALILSISFFGSYGAMTAPDPKEKDKVIGTAVDGSNILKLHIDKMMRFLSTDQTDMDVVYSNGMPNFFNEGVIRKDFIETGLAYMLAESYFEDLKEDLSVRLVKQKIFKGYTHPAAPFVSAENLWSQFLPSLSQSLNKVRSKDFEISVENLKTLFDLYVENSKFSTNFLRRFLGYQQNQYEWIAKDPYIERGDLSLFHFHNASDWFGASFVELVCQTIYNTAIHAKQKGYKVSYEEAKADLLKHGYDALAGQSEEKITAEVLDRVWKQTLGSLRLNEKEAVGIWREVLLFRKLFDDQGKSVLVDNFSYDQYHAYASEGREVELYTLPKELKLADFRSLLKFQTYLEAVSKHKKEAQRLALPTTFKSKEEIAVKTPELIQNTYEIELAQVNANEVGLGITLKEMWQWQSLNWSQLKGEFKEISALKNNQDPLDVLDHLDDKLRSAIDKFSVKQMLKNSPERIIENLNQKKLERKTLHISLKGEKVELAGIQDVKAFGALLDKALLNDQVTDKNIGHELEFFTQDGENYYRIHVLVKPTETKLLSFQEASSAGILDKILDEKLQKNHEAAQSANVSLFLKEDGSFKPFNSVKNDIGAYCYKDLIDAIEKEVNKGKQKASSSKESLDFYARHRFYDFVSKAKEDILKNGEASEYLKKDLPYFIQTSKEVIKRKDQKPWVTEETFSMHEKDFSNVHIGGDGELSFYQILNAHIEDKEETMNKIKEERNLLAQEAKKECMAQMIDLFHTTDSINLVKIGEEKLDVEEESL